MKTKVFSGQTISYTNNTGNALTPDDVIVMAALIVYVRNAGKSGGGHG